MAGIENYRAATAEECEKIEVGDRVRSYDFEFHDDCYVEGTVEVVTAPIEGCERYKIIADRRVWDGMETQHDLMYLPPVNGTRNSMGGYTNGVRKVQS
jgi:hypothetical protein